MRVATQNTKVRTPRREMGALNRDDDADEDKEVADAQPERGGKGEDDGGEDSGEVE